jgi:hypothetical protein
MNMSKQPLVAVETLSVLYLLTPLLIFFGGFIRVEIAVPACVLISFIIYELVRRTYWRQLLQWRTESAWFLLLAVLWVILSGGIGPIHQNTDWYKHYGIINFLIQHPWPAADHFAALGHSVVRYYLGWYLVPALLLKLSGAPAQTLVMSLWSIIGVFLFFSLLPQLIGRRKALVAAPVVFMLFGGADFIGTLITGFEHPARYHFEWWARWIQYSSNTTALFWVPQHALPAWLGAALLMRWRQHDGFLPYCAALGAAALLWSPFSTIGLLPFVFALTLQHGWRKLVLQWRAISSILLLAVPVALYLNAGAVNIPHGFIFALPCNTLGCFSWSSYLLVLALEVGVPLVIVLLHKEPEHGFATAAAIALCLVPLYNMGAVNDFAMRASLPSLAVIAILCAKAFPAGPRIAAAATIFVLLCALPTVAGEIARGFLPGEDMPANYVFDSDYNQIVLAQYFAPYPIWVLR